MKGNNHSPYVGPRAFQRGERLYGRERETMALLDLLIAERIVLLYSPSGAGKTSLINAALVPELETEGFTVLPTLRISLAPLEPSADSGRNRFLLSVLLALEEARPAPPEQSLAELQGLSLGQYLAKHWPLESSLDAQVLIFDQFEEIVTQDVTAGQERAAFFQEIGQVLQNRQRWALIAMREDFVAALDPFLRHIPTRLSTTMRLDLLDPASARLAVVEPARSAGVEFEETAARQLIDDLRRVHIQGPQGATQKALGPHVEPVQLQVVLRRIWERLPPETARITLADVRAVGNVDDALADYYDEQIARVASEGNVSERRLRDWIDAYLVTPQGIRGQVLQGPRETNGLNNDAIWALVDTHLLRAESRRGATWFELAHDRLLAPVQDSNAAWREAHLNMLQRHAALWEQEERPDSLLLHDAALAEAEQWAETHEDSLTAVEHAFLRESREAQAVAEREARQARRLRVLAIVASVVGIIALIAAALAILAYRRSVQEERLATSRQLAALALSNLSVDPERSILLGLQAVRGPLQADGTLVDEAVAALQQAVISSRAVETFSGHNLDAGTVAFSPDGTLLASGGGDNLVRLWDVEERRELAPLAGHTNWVLAVAFSPDGRLLASAGGDRTARLWDVASREQIQVLEGHDAEVAGVAFSPDRETLATGSWDGTVRLWSVADGALQATLQGHGEAVNRVAFSLDGRLMASASNDDTARIWDVGDQNTLHVLRGHIDDVYGVAFSPDGTRLATGSVGRTARLWDVASGEQLLTVRGFAQSVTDVAFHPDGGQVAAASDDGTIRVWDVLRGNVLLTLAGHTGAVRGVAYSPQGTLLASASRDSSVRLWNTEVGHLDQVTGIDFHPGGAMLATSSDDGTLALWRFPGLERQLTLRGHTNKVKDVAFSPDGRFLFSASDDFSGRIWETESGQPLHELEGHTSMVVTVKVSPDGRYVATSGIDRTARLWEAATGRPLHVLAEHDNWVRGMAFANGGSWLVTVDGNGTTRVWDVASGALLRQMAGSPAHSLAASPQGTMIAVALERGAVALWDAADGRHLGDLQGHSNLVYAVTFSPDGRRLASGSFDRKVIIWDVESRRRQMTIDHAYEVNDLAFSPGGTWIAVAGMGAGIYVYPLDVNTLLQLAQERLTRGWTTAECVTYLQQAQCPPMP